MRSTWLALGMTCLVGCQSQQVTRYPLPERALDEQLSHQTAKAPRWPGVSVVDLDRARQTSSEKAVSKGKREFGKSDQQTGKTGMAATRSLSAVETDPDVVPNRPAAENDSDSGRSQVELVGHQSEASSKKRSGRLTIDGQSYRLELVEENTDESEGRNRVQTASGTSVLMPLPEGASFEDAETTPDDTPHQDWSSELPYEGRPINLPTALSMIGGQHPVVGFAQWRVQEAYAQLQQADVLWLPSIQPGFGFHKHDGTTQTTAGSIVDLHRNSFQYGLGTGANAAGTSPNPGIVAQFRLADAIFQPEILEKQAWARGHRADAVFNRQLLDVSLAYQELLTATQERKILDQTLELTEGLAKLTKDFAESGQGLQADADRLETEVVLVNDRLISADERVAVASTRLARELSLNDASQKLQPTDVTVLPLEMCAGEMDCMSLIQTGLSQRPELQESQALVAAAFEEYKRQKYSPFIPSVLLGFSTGGFGGGLGNTIDTMGDRYDFDAVLTWEVRNLGLGERGARREANSRIEQAKFEKVRMIDQVSQQIAEAHEQISHRRRRIDVTKRSIQVAENSYERNLSRIRDGQGLPLEALQSIRALEQARLAYLQAVTEYNNAQFQLQWALGWKIQGMSPQQ